MRLNLENTGFLSGLTIAGFAFVMLGVNSNKPVWTAIGGAMLGASVSGLLELKILLRIEDRIISVITGTITLRFSSDENKIAPYRRLWHLYHVTEMDGKRVWRHHIWDFTKPSAVGTLQTKVITEKSGNKLVYQMEGGLRDQRLIVFHKPSAIDEPTSIHILPLFTEEYDEHYGIALLKTWDHNHALVPVIVSSKTLFEIEALDTVEDRGKAEKLDEAWNSGFYESKENKKHKLLFPNFVHQTV